MIVKCAREAFARKRDDMTLLILEHLTRATPYPSGARLRIYPPSRSKVLAVCLSVGRALKAASRYEVGSKRLVAYCTRTRTSGTEPQPDPVQRYTVKPGYKHIGYSDILDIMIIILETTNFWCKLMISWLLRYIIRFFQKLKVIIVTNVSITGREASKTSTACYYS